ncbi:hypothetical protein PCASD_09143 [Puccinia coronata f. sp. avenae]|uniref:Uncharacterized protein n=1 Tax=Puccinia coronata f. sp. avenae TaxID=200324 RepID=A0A2N5V4J4_9BASI|nr:hypothetical protein PCASD_09143 [Puccinia coronata f. sp. avenae]
MDSAGTGHHMISLPFAKQSNLNSVRSHLSAPKDRRAFTHPRYCCPSPPLPMPQLRILLCAEPRCQPLLSPCCHRCGARVPTTAEPAAADRC